MSKSILPLIPVLTATLLLTGEMVTSEETLIPLQYGNSSHCTPLSTEENGSAITGAGGICFFLLVSSENNANNEVSILQLHLPNLMIDIALWKSRLRILTKMTYRTVSQIIDQEMWTEICASSYFNGSLEVTVAGSATQTTELLKQRPNIIVQNTSKLCVGSTDILSRGSLLGNVSIQKIALSPSPLTVDACGFTYGETFSMFDAKDLVIYKEEWSEDEQTSFLPITLSEMCTENQVTTLIKHWGTYVEHEEFCNSLWGALAYNVSLPILIKSANNECSAKDKDNLVWVAERQTGEITRDSKCKVMIANGNIQPKYCLGKVACSFCRIKPETHVFRFGKEDQFDRELKLNSEKGILFLEGSTSYLELENDTWILRSEIHEEYMQLNTTKSPIGRHEWTKSDGTNILQTFSLCQYGEYCCNNGECIGDDNARCNGFVECTDGSDEIDCSLIEKSEGYVVKQSPTISEEVRRVLNLTYLLTVDHISAIYNSDGLVTLDFHLVLNWRESRVKFWNLKEGRILGSNDLWTPSLTWRGNNEEGLNIIVKDPTEILTVGIKEDEEDDYYQLSESDPYMGQVVSGEYVQINSSTTGRITWNCGFILYLFPFGSQNCTFFLQTNNPLGSAVHLFHRKPNYTGIIILNNQVGEVLGEYELVIADDTPEGEHVKFVLSLKSAWGYYLLNSYLPSFLIFLLACSTFFFPIESFNERVMVSLTSLLVLTTFFDQTSQSVVHTSYPKLIDYWFTLLIVANFLVMMANVVINSVSQMHDKASEISSKVAPEQFSPRLKEKSHARAKHLNRWIGICVCLATSVFMVLYALMAYTATT